jgi:hypothetical protein
MDVDLSEAGRTDDEELSGDNVTVINDCCADAPHLVVTETQPVPTFPRRKTSTRSDGRLPENNSNES